MSTHTQPGGVRHSWLDDLVGLGSGIMLLSVAFVLLGSGGVVTGGTAGLALLLSYAMPVPFTVLFVVINLPFFALAVRQKGWRFTVRSLLSVIAMSLLTELVAATMGPLDIPAWFAALFGNVLAGVGLLCMFRHDASMGGFGILALLAQERLGWRAGYVQMTLDAAVVLASFAVVAPLLVLISAAGAVILNLILALNHRPGRYTGY